MSTSYRRKLRTGYLKTKTQKKLQHQTQEESETLLGKLSSLRSSPDNKAKLFKEFLISSVLSSQNQPK